MTSDRTPEPSAEPWIDVVRRKVAALRFGSVQIVIHEGRVTQVDSTEKTRLGETLSGDKSDDARKR